MRFFERPKYIVAGLGVFDCVQFILQKHDLWWGVRITDQTTGIVVTVCFIGYFILEGQEKILHALKTRE